LSTIWNFSTRAKEVKSSVIREILKITERPDIISFAGGLPAPELFPVEEIKKACIKVLDESGSKALQYSLTMGHLPLRRAIAERISKRDGIKVTEENIVITGGSQQGLDIMGKLFLDSTSTLIIEKPSYLGAIQAFNSYRPTYITVGMDNEGMLLDEMEEDIKKHKPRFIYAVANFQNPSGITMSLKRRKRLVELSKEFYTPIVDDNPYGEIRYQGKDLPSLKSLGGDNVIELGTCSKIISPGLRIGWIVGPADVMLMIEKLKQGIDLHTNTFAQYVVYEYIKTGQLDEHITKIKKAYGERIKVMLEALETYFTKEIKWTKPEGGLFLWVELPQGNSATDILPKAVAQKVAYVPGKPFFVDESGDNTLRLNFSNATPEMIVEGIKRLGKVFKENIK